VGAENETAQTAMVRVGPPVPVRDMVCPFIFVFIFVTDPVTRIYLPRQQVLRGGRTLVEVAIVAIAAGPARKRVRSRGRRESCGCCG